MAHNMKNRDRQQGINMGWHGKTEIQPKIEFTTSPHNVTILEKPVFVDGVALPGYKALIASDDGQIMDVANGTYKVIQNSVVWELLANSLAGIPHEIESCGTVGDRSKWYTSIKLGELSTYQIGAREFKSNVNAIWSHDGTMGLFIHDSNVCIVCQNTINASMGSEHSFNFVVKHTKNANSRLTGIEEAITQLQADRLAFKTQLEVLHNTPCELTQAERILLGFVAEGKKELSTRAENTANRMKELFVRGAGNSGDTMLDLLSGVTEYYTHESSGKNDDQSAMINKQFASSEFGAASVRKAGFFQALTDPKRLQTLEETGETLLKGLLSRGHVASETSNVTNGAALMADLMDKQG